MVKLHTGPDSANTGTYTRAKVTTLEAVNQIIAANFKPKKAGKKSRSGAGFVHTLAHLDHPQASGSPKSDPDRRDRGSKGKPFEGTKKPISDLKVRAKVTHFSKELARYLTALDSPLNKAYRRTLFDCCSTIMQEGQKLTARYCKSRWCSTCNRIRTAKLINGYRGPLSGFADPCFVTLSLPNVFSGDLRASIRKLLKLSSLMLRAKRRAGNAVNGVRKLECTYNVDEDTFHPHLHFIVDGEANAAWMVSEWLKRNPDASYKGQDWRKADSGSLMELFKYTTKIVTKADGVGRKIYIPALDTIFQAMQDVRTFQPFGNVRAVSEEIDELDADTYEIEPYEFLVWVWEGSDWHAMPTGKPLTGYEPSPGVIHLLTDAIVT